MASLALISWWHRRAKRQASGIGEPADWGFPDQRWRERVRVAHGKTPPAPPAGSSALSNHTCSAEHSAVHDPPREFVGHLTHLEHIESLADLQGVRWSRRRAVLAQNGAPKSLTFLGARHARADGALTSPFSSTPRSQKGSSSPIEGPWTSPGRRQQDKLGHFLRRRFFVFLGGDLREAAVF
jgi:hypothetical protein